MATDISQAALDYLNERKTVTLATASPEGEPHASTFMYVNDGVTLYFWARPSSATASHLHTRPAVSFAIDEYVPDWNKAKGIQGNGECQPVSFGDEMAKVIGLMADKFPSPSSGASTANIAFFKITPTKLQFIDNTDASKDVSAGEDFGVDFNREEVVFSD
jgi:uncharacterized protein YhbP (UPF0306 family)